MNYIPDNFGGLQLEFNPSPKTDQLNSSRTTTLQRSATSSKVHCPVCDKGDYTSSVMAGEN
jgi:hypothetical protein